MYQPCICTRLMPPQEGGLFRRLEWMGDKRSTLTGTIELRLAASSLEVAGWMKVILAGHR